MFLSLKEKKISILNALNSISLWFKQAMLYFWKDYMGSNGGVVLFKNREGEWSWNITHAWQAKYLLDLSDEIVHRWWAIQHSGPAAQRKKDTESCDGHYISTSVLFSFHCSLNSEMEVCKETESLHQMH